MSKTDVSSLQRNFQMFINKHRCEKENTTHTILVKGSAAGKFCFKGKTYQDFLEKYIELVKTGVDLHFVEKPNDNGVTYLLIDVDYDQKGPKRIYTEDHIKQIIETTNNFIQENFNVTNYQLTSFVTEKTKPSKRDNNPNMYKDGFHICYPHLPLEEKHRYFVIDYLSELMESDEFLEGIDYKNEAEKIFDKSIIKSNGIMMIGSKKKGCSPYLLTHVYDFALDNLGIEEYDEEELIYTLSNQRYDTDGKIEAIDDEDVLENIETIYSQYGGGNKKKKPKTNTPVSDSRSSKNTKTRETSSNDRQNSSQNNNNNKNKQKSILNERDIVLAREICKILSRKRAHDYVSWRRTAFALRSIDDSLYNDFVEFSKKDMAKYREGKISCDDIWRAADKYTQFYNIETLKHWARIDNSNEYYKIMRRLNDAVFGRAETGKHVDLADIVYTLYKGRFVCVDITKKKWYEYQDNRWVLVQSAYTLEELISDEVRKMMRMYCSEKLKQSAEMTDGNMQDDDHKKYMRLMKTIDCLGDVNFRENVVRACANKFYDADFQAKLDSNVYLVGFLNGVYDLKEGCFRDGLPSDYVSKTVGYEWMEYEEDDPIFDKINNFFSQVQIDEDMRIYILTFIAKTLRGIPDSKLHMWTGGGGNGKSATIDLIKHMLGDYFSVVPVTILTRKRTGSSNATPELADKFGKRFLVIQEPEHNDVVFVGQMKEYTGKDQIMARPLYGDPFYYTPQFTMVLTCNNLPYIPATDNGTWRRLRVAPFESEFVDENPTESYQFLKDEDLQEDFPNWAQPLIWLIITKYYPIYEKGVNGKKFKIYEPEKVKTHTNDYKIGSDVYAEFIEENIDKTNDKKGDIESMASVHKQFKEWYFNSYSEKPPPKKLFVSYLKKNGYTIENQNIYGIRTKYSATLV
jgi:P4 family phage/plasmid primase-like protien